jgi:hypothetical protein
MPCNPLEASDDSEENVAPIFEVEQYAKQEVRTKQAESTACFAYSSTLKTEGLCSFETSADFQQACLRRYNWLCKPPLREPGMQEKRSMLQF